MIGMITPGSGPGEVETPKAEKGVSVGVAVVIVVALALLLVGGGVAVGYRYFWSKFTGPKVWDAQIARWESVLKKNPKDVEGWFQVGYAHLQKGELIDAENAFKKALKIDPKSTELNYFLGQVKMKQRQYAEAEALFKKVVDIAPGNPLPHYALADVLIQEKKYDQALQRLDYIIEKIDPTLVDVLYLKGVALEGKNQKDKAIASYKEALRYDPSFQAARDALRRLGISDKDLPQMPADTARPGQITVIKPNEPGATAGLRPETGPTSPSKK